MTSNYKDPLISRIRQYLNAKIDTYLNNQRKKRILRYFSTLPTEQRTPYLEELNFLQNNEFSVFPYSFLQTYLTANIEILEDTQRAMKYVMHEGKRLYFRRDWTDKRIAYSYKFLCAEQDLNSPHRYLLDDFQVDANDTVFDVGAAEGNFSLSIVENVKKLVLFEADPDWIEALQATFEPWKDKVEIVNAFVSNQTQGKFISIDDYIKKSQSFPTFLKLDVDGAEIEVVAGAEHTLNELKPLKIAFCTYHKATDATHYFDMLTQKQFSCSYSKGYMLFFYYKPFQAPFFRKGLIRAKR